MNPIELLQRAGGFSGIARRFIRNPGESVRASRRLWSAGFDSRFIRSVTDSFREEFLDIYNPKLELLEAAFADVQGSMVRGKVVAPGNIVSEQAFLLYSLVRRYNLVNVVETGVCNGLSSHVLLKALSREGRGHLTSIDLPEFSDESGSAEQWSGKGGAVVPAGREVGWLVESVDRINWTLKLGPTSSHLRPLLKDIGPIDLFVHDSEHSYENQLFEFSTGFEALRPGGYILASDIQWSTAFDDFWKQYAGSARCWYLGHSCALVQKNVDSGLE